MKTLKISIQPLTPIWTGGADRKKTDRLHETGIIGSIRWWYEAIVRGLGGSACDPTGHICSYKKECLLIRGDDPRSNKDRLRRYLKGNFEIDWAKNSDIIDDGKTIRIYKDENSAEILVDEENKKATLKLSDGRSRNLKIEIENDKLNLYDLGICDACQIFGATGWKGRFDLRIVQDETRPAWDGTELNIRPPERNTGWFLPAGRIGNFTLMIRGDSDIVDRFASLFLFLESRGAIGAKPQLGYGFFKIVNRSEVSECAMNWDTVAYESGWGGGTDRSDLPDLLPDLRQFIFFKYRFKPARDDWWTRIGGVQRLIGNQKTATVLSQLAQQGMVPVSPVMKNHWRYVEWDAPFSAKRWLFGSSTGEDRLRSRVSVSWAYREGGVWVVRGWASIPEEERTKSGVFQHRQDVDLLEKMLGDESIWKKTLNLDYSTPTDLNVDRLTDRDIIRFMEG